MSDRRLQTRIQDCIREADIKTADFVSDRLRRKFPEYGRKDRQTLRSTIQQELNNMTKGSSSSSAGNGGGGASFEQQSISNQGVVKFPSKKKRKTESKQTSNSKAAAAADAEVGLSSASPSSSPSLGGSGAIFSANAPGGNSLTLSAVVAEPGVGASSSAPPLGDSAATASAAAGSASSTSTTGADDGTTNAANADHKPTAVVAAASTKSNRSLLSLYKTTSARENNTSEQQQSSEQQQNKQPASASSAAGSNPTAPATSSSGASAAAARRLNRLQQGNSGKDQPSNHGSNLHGTGQSSNNAWSPADCEVTEAACDLDAMGGIDSLKEEIRDLILYPLQYPELFRHVGADPPTGVLLHGPPGSGKSKLAQAIMGTLKKISEMSSESSNARQAKANKANIEDDIRNTVLNGGENQNSTTSSRNLLVNNFSGTTSFTDISCFQIAAPEIVSGVSGESENKLRQLFEHVKQRQPALLFFDEIDAITPKRDHSDRQMDKRIVAQFSHCLDSLNKENVLVLGATNRSDSIDSGLRRAGRFDREIAMGIPNLNAREEMLQIICRGMRVDSSCCGAGGNGRAGMMRALAKLTPGYVAADLVSLTQEAALVAVKSFFSGKEKEVGVQSKAIADADEKQKEDNLQKAAALEADADAEKDATMTEKAAFEARNDFHVPQAPSKASKRARSNGKRDRDASESESDDEDENETDAATSGCAADAEENTKTATSGSKSAVVPTFRITDAEMESVAITMPHFQQALKKVQPSALREGFATSPDVSWDDVGGMVSLREELELAIIQPIKKAELFESLGLSTPAGVLLYGPPGCGKTLLAKAVASAANANFISVKGPELLNKYVGESERAVRSVFQRARTSSPCIIFFDELDSMAPKRSSEGTGSSERVVNQLLTEMDGMNSRRDVFVIAATNRPDIIDAAMLRPGRLDKMLYVALPDESGRLEILRSLTRKSPLSGELRKCEVSGDANADADADRSSAGGNEANKKGLASIASMTEGFTGADLGALCREATIRAMKTYLAKLNQKALLEPAQQNSNAADMAEARQGAKEVVVEKRHFVEALEKVVPSVSARQQTEYKNLAAKMQKEARMAGA